MASINRNALTARSGTKRITIFQDMWVHTAGCVVGFAPLSSIGMLSWQGFSLKSSRDIHRYLSAGYVSSTDMQDRSCMPENLQDLANRLLPPTEIGLTRFWVGVGSHPGVWVQDMWVLQTCKIDLACLRICKILQTGHYPPLKSGLPVFGLIFFIFFYFYPLNDVFWLFFWYMASLTVCFFIPEYDFYKRSNTSID